MKCVILSRKQIPGYGVRGPILTPAEYDVHQILKWINVGVDIREVMEDGSYRKLKYNDPKLMELLNQKLDKQAEEKLRIKALRDNEPEMIRPQGNVQLRPEKIHKPKPRPVEPKKEAKVEVKQEEKKQEVKEEKVDLFIDELERPE